MNNARFVTDRIHLTEEDRPCIPVPLYHCFGKVMGVLGAISNGAAMVFPGEGFDATTALSTDSDERCSALYGAPRNPRAAVRGTGGENIYPREIEDHLFRHPQIREAHIFGIPDAGFGEEVCVWVIPTTGSQLSEQDIRSFCRGTIAHYKVPRFVRVVSVLALSPAGHAPVLRCPTAPTRTRTPD